MQYCCALLPSTLTTRWVLPRRFLWYSDAVLIMFALWFSFWFFLDKGERWMETWKENCELTWKRIALRVFLLWSSHLCRLSCVLNRKTGLCSRESEELDAPSNLQNKPNTQAPCAPKAHISFHTCKSRNLLASLTLGYLIISAFVKSQSLSK